MLPSNLICFSWEPWDLDTKKRTVPLVLALLKLQLVRRILYVNPPANLFQVIRGRHPSYLRAALKYLWPRKVENVYVFTPTYPLPDRFKKWNGFVGRMQVTMLKKLLRFTPYVYLNVYPHEEELQAAFGDAAVSVLDMYDDFGNMFTPDEMNSPWAQRIRAAVDEAARLADCITVVNSTLAEKFAKICARTIVLRNAVDYELFDAVRKASPPPPATLATLPQPIIGFMGQVDPRADFNLIKFLSAQRPAWSFVFLGPLHNPGIVPDEVRCAGNIHFIPPVTYDELPRHMLCFSAGIVPYEITPFTRGIDPLKVYLYLAAGLPVVTTAVGGIEVFGNLVRVADSSQSFLEQLEAALKDNAPDEIASRLQYARDNSWQRRAQDLKNLVEQCAPA